MRLRKLDQIATQTTLPTQRRLFQRQRSNSSLSRDISRRSLKQKSLKSMISIPYIKMNTLDIKEYSNVLKLNITPQKTLCINKKLTFPQTTLKKQQSKDTGQKQKQLQNKIQELLQETIQRQEELNQMTLHKQNMLYEMDSLKNKIQILENANTKLRQDQYNLKQDIRKLTKQRNTIQSEKQVLSKKLADCQRNKFLNFKSSGINNLQNLRQQYLEKQLLELRTKLSKEKSILQAQLQLQLEQLRQKLFNSNKIIQNLRINNLCLQQKNEKIIKQLKSTPQLLGLKSKYRRTLQQLREVKRQKQNTLRQLQNLVSQNKKLIKQLETLKQLPLNQQSLNFSIMSHLE